MKTKRIIYLIVGFLIGMTGAILTLSWFNYKLLIIFMLLLWSNNISNSDTFKR